MLRTWGGESLSVVESFRVAEGLSVVEVTRVAESLRVVEGLRVAESLCVAGDWGVLESLWVAERLGVVQGLRFVESLGVGIGGGGRPLFIFGIRNLEEALPQEFDGYVLSPGILIRSILMILNACSMRQKSP